MPSAILLHRIEETADISMDDISRSRQLAPKHSFIRGMKLDFNWTYSVWLGLTWDPPEVCQQIHFESVSQAANEASRTRETCCD